MVWPTRAGGGVLLRLRQQLLSSGDGLEVGEDRVFAGPGRRRRGAGRRVCVVSSEVVQRRHAP